MTLDDAVEFSNSTKIEITNLWSLKNSLSEEEFEKLLSERNKKQEEYREKFIFKGKHIIETFNIFKVIRENFSFNDYDLIVKTLCEHLKNTKDDIFLLDSSYDIHEYGDCLYITVYSKFKNYPRHFEQYLSIHKNV